MKVIEKAYYSPVGKKVAAKAGLSEPPRLRRGRDYPRGPVVLAAPAGSTLVAEALELLGRTSESPVLDTGGDKAPGYGDRIGAVVLDATGLTDLTQLEELRQVLRPAMRAIEGSGRVIIVGSSPEGDWERLALTQALDGINRTVAKELRKGATSNLVYVDPDVTAVDLLPTLAFLLEGRSAFVDGQAWTVRAAGLEEADTVGGPAERPLAGLTIAVTGAARGIGEAIARTLARDGAEIIAIDIPPAGEALANVANDIGGVALQLDITAPDAGERIAALVAGRGGSLHGIVHNAGVTRDKMLANLDQKKWAQVLDINLAAQLRINKVLLDPATQGGLVDGGRIVGVSSMVGFGGNAGQTNYAASKAGVIGLVRAMAPDLAARGITINAVAPGFIETEMTQLIPFVKREVMRRTNSLDQGGKPVDVAETIGYFLDPRAAGVTGQVIRVCGQNLMGQ
ncbi:3-oxoacyl-ACP reductase [Demequina pelophila]|uniref:3-oxoacyl-ACP reductase n=1 Tax=Demequina pelophila TaxID=1638984 RepID=UPI000785CFDC|nr:3-oxoacyl-ACP reductase [Demequina pelophila]